MTLKNTEIATTNIKDLAFCLGDGGGLSEHDMLNILRRLDSKCRKEICRAYSEWSG